MDRRTGAEVTGACPAHGALILVCQDLWRLGTWPYVQSRTALGSGARDARFDRYLWQGEGRSPRQTSCRGNGMGSDMSYIQHLAKGAGQGSPPFWIIAIGLIVLVGVVFLLSRARRKRLGVTRR